MIKCTHSRTILHMCISKSYTGIVSIKFQKMQKPNISPKNAHCIRILKDTKTEYFTQKYLLRKKGIYLDLVKNNIWEN